MKKNQHSGIPVTLWYLSETKIRKLEGVPFKSKYNSFDFKITRKDYTRIVRLNRKNVLFCCPKNIKHFSKRQFMNLFEILKLGRIKDAFSSEVISEFEKHISALPDPLKTFVTDSFDGAKKPDPKFDDSEYMDILKCWVEYVFSKLPKGC